MEKRESFNSKWGFILACIGSAVGMGNLWMFPTRVSLYGGGSFLIPYFIFVALIGSTGVIGKCAWDAAPAPVQSTRSALPARHAAGANWVTRSVSSGSRFPRDGDRLYRRHGLDLKYAIGAFTGATLSPADTDGFASAFGSMASAFETMAGSLPPSSSAF